MRRILLLGLMLIVALSVFGCSKERVDSSVSNVSESNSSFEEITEEIVPEGQMKYIDAYGEFIEKLLDKIATDYSDSSFVIKKIYITDYSQEESDDLIDIRIKGIENNNGNEKLVYYGYGLSTNYLGIFDNDVSNEVKWIEGYFDGKMDSADGDIWDVDEDNGIIHRTRDGRYGCNIYYVKICDLLIKQYQDYYTALYE